MRTIIEIPEAADTPKRRDLGALLAALPCAVPRNVRAMKKSEPFYWIAVLALAWCFWNQSARAAGTALEAQVREAIGRTPQAAGARVELDFPPWEPPAAFAGCLRAEPFVLPGTRLWGASRIGVKCVEGGSATALMPVTVRVFTPGFLVARPLAAGATIGTDDLAPAEVEASAAPGVPVAQAQEAVGRAAARALPVGTILRAEALRTRNAINAGDLVRVVYDGAGFSISTDGKALSAAQEGQPLRVQTEAGRVLSGTARANRVVELRPGAGS